MSQRIESEAERERLKRSSQNIANGRRFIIRTTTEGVHRQEMAADAAYLKRISTKVIERKSRTQPAIGCLASCSAPARAA